MSGQIYLDSDRPGAAGPGGAAGSTGPAGAGSSGLWQPADNGLVAANMDPLFAAASVLLTAGKVYLFRAKMSVDSIVSAIGLELRSPNAAGLANTFVGLYTISGAVATLLAQSSDCSAALQGGNETKVNLSSPTSLITAGTNLHVAILCGTATTGPTMLGQSGRPNGFASQNAKRSVVTKASGISALPATIDISATASVGVDDTAMGSIGLFA